MKNILVTGGSGFIGSHTCYALLAEGYEITVLDSLANSSKRSLDQIIKIFKSQDLDFSNKLRFFEGDIRNKDFINSIFKKAVEEKKPIDGVIHFAGLKAVAESVLKPLSYWDNNVFGSLNILKIMKNFNCHNFIFSSSATIYKSVNKAKIKERESELPIGTAVILDGRKKFGIAMSDEKVLFLDELQPAGKKPMNGADFLNGYTIESGEIIWEYGNS